MQKLSPAYREDSPEGISPEMKAYLDENFLGKLKNRTVLNAKMLVVFSGGNAVGKSVLSRKIESVLKGVVIENDAIKIHILKFKSDITHEELQLATWRYTMDLYGRISQVIDNGLIVRDGVIDWYYDRILPIFEAQGYTLFIIGYELSEKKSIELIRLRGDKQTVSAERLISQLYDHTIHQRRFRSIYKPDVLLDDDSVFEHDMVIEALKQKLEQLNQK